MGLKCSYVQIVLLSFKGYALRLEELTVAVETNKLCSRSVLCEVAS